MNSSGGLLYRYFNNSIPQDKKNQLDVEEEIIWLGSDDNWDGTFWQNVTDISGTLGKGILNIGDM